MKDTRKDLGLDKEMILLFLMMLALALVLSFAFYYQGKQDILREQRDERIDRHLEKCDLLRSEVK